MEGNQYMICERIMMSAPPFGSASPSFGLKASKAKKPRMLILLVICIHDKALCIQLTNVQISFTELKSSKDPFTSFRESELTNDLKSKIKTPSFHSGNQSFELILKSKAKALRYAQGIRVFN
jgi:hypothetical protein